MLLDTLPTDMEELIRKADFPMARTYGLNNAQTLVKDGGKAFAGHMHARRHLERPYHFGADPKMAFDHHGKGEERQRLDG